MLVCVSGGLDVGDNSLSDDGCVLTELGVHSPYLEVWHRVDDGTARSLAMELIDNVEGRRGYAVLCGNQFGFAVGRPIAPEGSVEYAVTNTVSSCLTDLALAKGWEASLVERALSSYGGVVGVVSSLGWVASKSVNDLPDGWCVFTSSDDVTVTDTDGKVVDAMTSLSTGMTVAHTRAAGSGSSPFSGSFVWRVLDVSLGLPASIFMSPT